MSPRESSPAESGRALWKGDVPPWVDRVLKGQARRPPRVRTDVSHILPTVRADARSNEPGGFPVFGLPGREVVYLLERRSEPAVALIPDPARNRPPGAAPD